MPVSDRPTGWITSNITHGELFLHPTGRAGKTFRLRWQTGDVGARRAVPAGTYRVSGYRRIRAAADGSSWIWSTTSPGFTEVEIPENASVHLDVRRSPRVRARAFVHAEKQRLGLAFQAEERLGHTLYQDGRRITIRWQCLGNDLRILSEGPMRYG